jgi:hypothetical protein
MKPILDVVNEALKTAGKSSVAGVDLKAIFNWPQASYGVPADFWDDLTLCHDINGKYILFR